MTAIAALAHGGKVYMGADSAAVQDRHYLTIAATPKVFTAGPLIFGYTSSFAMGHALQHRLNIPDNLPPAHELDVLDRWMAVPFMDAVRECLKAAGYLKTENGREHSGQFLVGARGQIYLVNDDLHANRQLAPYGAVGSGETACLAAFHVISQLRTARPHPDCTVRAALEAAQSCVTTVRGPFTILAGGEA